MLFRSGEICDETIDILRDIQDMPSKSKLTATRQTHEGHVWIDLCNEELFYRCKTGELGNRVARIHVICSRKLVSASLSGALGARLTNVVSYSEFFFIAELTNELSNVIEFVNEITSHA